MKLLIAGSIILLAYGVGEGQEQVVRQISWGELYQRGQLLTGEVQRGDPPGPGEYLVIANTQSAPITVSLLALPDPGITTTQYALTGSVSYEGVTGTGYLEMWNYFQGGGAYFSKTLGESGPMGSLRGSSNWRPFSLPFFSNAEAGAPSKLEFNLVLPGPGTVRLGPLRLVQYPEGYNPFSTPGAWWNDRTAGWIGGIGGSICGSLGALIGILSGLGKSRRFVILLCVLLIAFGLACLMAGAIAWLVSQPYAVYYPLLLFGVICTAVVGGILPGILRRYRQIELRRMTSMDLDAASA
jgi:hypothetical protein